MNTVPESDVLVTVGVDKVLGDVISVADIDGDLKEVKLSTSGDQGACKLIDDNNSPADSITISSFQTVSQAVDYLQTKIKIRCTTGGTQDVTMESIDDQSLRQESSFRIIARSK